MHVVSINPGASLMPAPPRSARTPSSASTYTSTGNTFLLTTPPYTTSDRVRGYFTTSNPLVPDLTSLTAVPLISQLQTVDLADSIDDWSEDDSSLYQPHNGSPGDG